MSCPSSVIGRFEGRSELDQVGVQVLNLNIQRRSSQSSRHRLVSDKIIKISNLFACLVALSIPSLVAQVTATEEMFPFVIPELAAPPAGSAVDVTWLNDRPAGGHGLPTTPTGALRRLCWATAPSITSRALSGT